MKNVFGGIMLGCGILIAALSGLCLLAGVVSMGFEASSGSTSGMLTAVPAILIVGGIPLAIGIGLFFAGKSLMNSPKPAPVEPPVPPEEVKRAAPPENRDPDGE